jgi:hypothetical protein
LPIRQDQIKSLIKMQDRLIGPFSEILQFMLYNANYRNQRQSNGNAAEPPLSQEELDARDRRNVNQLNQEIIQAGITGIWLDGKKGYGGRNGVGHFMSYYRINQALPPVNNQVVGMQAALDRVRRLIDDGNSERRQQVARVAQEVWTIS